MAAIKQLSLAVEDTDWFVALGERMVHDIRPYRKPINPVASRAREIGG
jgi:hypothetical protein